MRWCNLHASRCHWPASSPVELPVVSSTARPPKTPNPEWTFALQHASEIGPLNGVIGSWHPELLAVQWLDLDRAGDIPLPNAKTDGVQENAAIDDVHVSGEVVQLGIFATLDLRPAIFRMQMSAASSFGKLTWQSPATVDLDSACATAWRCSGVLARRANPPRLGAEESCPDRRDRLGGTRIGGKAPPASCCAAPFDTRAGDERDFAYPPSRWRLLTIGVVRNGRAARRRSRWRSRR